MLLLYYNSAKGSFPRFLLQYVLRIRSAILTKVNPYIYCHGGLHMISMAINAPLMANTIEKGVILFISGSFGAGDNKFAGVLIPE